MTATSATDSRGISETTGVAVLIVVTVLVTASVGINVIVVADNEEEPQASFEFEFLEDANALLVTHAGGQEIPAGDLYIDGSDNNVSWAQIAGNSDDAMVGASDVIQVSDGSPYGSGVTQRDTIEIVYTPSDANRTVLATWPEGNEGDPGLGEDPTS